MNGNGVTALAETTSSATTDGTAVPADVSRHEAVIVERVYGMRHTDGAPVHE